MSYLGLSNQLLQLVTQETLVLGLGLEHFAVELHDLRIRVIADTRELNHLDALGLSEVEVVRRDLENDFVGGGVILALVGGVAEAENLALGGGDERLGEL